MVLLALVPSSGNTEMALQWAVVSAGKGCRAMSLCVCGDLGLQHLYCFPELAGLEARENFAVTFMSLHDFAYDSIVTFPVKRSCLPKSLSAF